MNDITQTPPPTTRRAFIVRVKNGQNQAQKKAIDHGVIGIGWSKISDMNRKWAQGELKEQIKVAYPKYKGRGLGNVAGSIERFCSMEIDDYVLMPTGKGFYLGKVNSSIIKCNEEWVAKTHLQWQRKVTWEPGKITSEAVDYVLQKRLKIRQTCVEVTDLIAHIEAAALAPNKKHSFSEGIRQNPTEAGVIEAFRFVNDRKLEVLVRELCKADGKTATICAKKSSIAGDADVKAHHSDIEANKNFIDLYQVKRHERRSGHHGVNQIIKRINALQLQAKSTESPIYKGYLVTTAIDVSSKAAALAKEHNITIVTRGELIKWILKHHKNLEI